MKSDAIPPAPPRPRAGRVLLGAASPILGFVFGTLALAAIGSVQPWSLALVFGILLLGFLATGLTRTARSPWRPLRLCLLFAGALNLYLLSAVQWPPSGPALVTAVFLIATVILTFGAGVLVSSSPRLALVSLAVLAGCGMLAAYRVLAQVEGIVLLSAAPEAAVILSFMLSGTLWAAWLGGLWHGRALWAAGLTIR